MSLAERFRDAFSTTDEPLDFLNATMLRILAALQGLSTSGSSTVPESTTDAMVNGYLPSRTDFLHGQRAVTVAGTAEQLVTGPILVPKGYPITILAFPSNVGIIYIGKSKTEAESGQYFNGLDAGLAISIRIDDLSKIWINSSSNGDSVSWLVESGEAVG